MNVELERTLLLASPGESGEIIAYRGVEKRFWAHGKETVALRDVNLSVRRNEFISIVGPSGCGKSTLLTLCAGLDVPSSGETLYRGAVVEGIAGSIGFVTQESNLYPWMTLRENVEFPLCLRGISTEERRTRVEAYLKLAGLTGFEDHYPHQLSGGMQKRGSIVRTMIYDPEVILMDEPFGALDAVSRMQLQSDLLRIWGHRRMTIIFITHDLQEAIALSDTVAVMSARPGTVRRSFPITLPRPRDVFTIHADPRFGAIYGEIWQYFREAIAETPLGARTEDVELPPPLRAPANAPRHVERPVRAAKAPPSPLVTTLGRLGALIAFFAVWQALSAMHALNPAIFSTPIDVLQRLVQLLGGTAVSGRSIYAHIWTTLQEMGIGYVLGAVAGIVVAVTLARSRLLSEIFEPIFLAFYSLPKIALAPLFLLFLGIGMASKIGVVTMEVFFLVFFNTFAGLRGIKRDYVQLARIMGADTGQLTRRVILPAVTPAILMGLRLGVPFAVIGAIIGEFMAADRGLGWFILYAGSNFDAPSLFASLAILVGIVSILNFGVTALERRALRWQPPLAGAAAAQP